MKDMVLNHGATQGLKLKFLVMDVDGTLTDGKVYIGEMASFLRHLTSKMAVE